jgi:hypothetical protein
MTTSRRVSRVTVLAFPVLVLVIIVMMAPLSARAQSGAEIMAAMKQAATNAGLASMDGQPQQVTDFGSPQGMLALMAGMTLGVGPDDIEHTPVGGYSMGGALDQNIVSVYVYQLQTEKAAEEDVRKAAQQSYKTLQSLYKVDEAWDAEAQDVMNYLMENINYQATIEPWQGLPSYHSTTTLLGDTAMMGPDRTSVLAWAQGTLLVSVTCASEKASTTECIYKMGQALHQEFAKLAVSAPLPLPSPTASPTAMLGDLSIEDGVFIFQAVEGGNLVSGRPVAVVVQPIWAGPPPPDPVNCQVTIQIDNNYVMENTGAVGSDIEFVIPASVFPAGVTADHVIQLRAEAVEATLEDPITDNNLAEFQFTTHASRSMRLMFMRILTAGDPKIVTIDELNRFAGEAMRYVWQVYPVPSVSRLAGSMVSVPGSSTWASASVVIAKTLLMYNNNRCFEWLENGLSRPISPCNIPRVDMAVGVFPGHYYGDEVEGWLYGRGSKTWMKWLDWAAEGFGWVSGGRAEIDRAAMSTVTNSFNLAHEIGHHFDLEDEAKEGREYGIVLDNVYLLENGKIIYLDQDYRTSNQIRRYINFMGEAGVDIPLGNRTWVNAESWNRILSRIERAGMIFAPVDVAGLDYMPSFQGASLTEVDGPALLVMGTLDAQGNAAIRTVDRLQHYTLPSADTGEYRLEALDNLGNSAGWADFNTYPLDIDQQVPFLVTIPLEGPGDVFNLVSEVRLSHNGSMVASAGRSLSAPTASFNAQPDLSTDPVTLSWTAQDADGDSLRSSVYYTVDGGQSWQVVSLDLTTTQLEIEPSALAGGNARFRVVVSDGMNETTILTSLLTVPNRPPQVTATLPWGDAFAEGEPVIVSAYGYDPEDGDLPESSLIWADKSGEQIGAGTLVRLSLEPGEHSLTVVGIDSAGQESSASVVVTVAAAPADEQPSTTTSGGWLSSNWVYLVSGLMIFFGLVGGGLGTFLVLRPVKNPLAKLYKDGVAWCQRYRAGRIPPAQLAQVQQHLQAQDHDGNLWSFDIARGQWLLWDA